MIFDNAEPQFRRAEVGGSKIFHADELCRDGSGGDDVDDNNSGFLGDYFVEISSPTKSDFN